jgi:hypothetical protein
VFALSTPGSAPLSALDLRMFAVVEPRNASSEDFELRDSIGTTFGFQARDAAEARTWVEVIERLRAKDKVQEEKEPASPEDNGQKAGSTQANKSLFIEKMMAQKSSRLAARNELESIDGIARHRAAAAVADSFQDSNDLRGLETFEEEIKAKLASVVRKGRSVGFILFGLAEIKECVLTVHNPVSSLLFLKPQHLSSSSSSSPSPPSSSPSLSFSR